LVLWRPWLTTGQRLPFQVKLSTRTASGLKYRVLAHERPVPDARSVEPTLEDSYLWLIRQA
jgi:hypothetical protein